MSSKRLNELLYAYNYCRRHLGKRNGRKESTSVTFSTMNQVRGKLIQEMNRLSWQLWPMTGRPGNGN